MSTTTWKAGCLTWNAQAKESAALVDVERLVMQECSGTAPWDYRPLVTVLVGQVVDRLGAPDGVLAFDPRS